MYMLFGWSTEKQNKHELFCTTHYRNVGNLLETVIKQEYNGSISGKAYFFLFSKRPNCSGTTQSLIR
jgi:hypothetical protein